MVVWDVDEERIVHTLERGAYLQVFSPDSSLLLTADASGLMEASANEATLHDLTDDGRAIVSLIGHTDIVTDASFHPDGTRVATASLDGTLRIWDVTMGAALLVLSAHDAPVHSVAYSTDGALLASADDTGLVRVWAMDIDALVQLARDELPRGFRRAECRQYLHADRCADMDGQSAG